MICFENVCAATFEIWGFKMLVLAQAHSFDPQWFHGVPSGLDWGGNWRKGGERALWREGVGRSGAARCERERSPAEKTSAP